MATTQDDIRDWLTHAKAKGATHMLVVCDTFDWEDYPVSVAPTENVQECVKYYHGPNMQKVMEVYDLSKDLEAQITMARAGQEYLR